MISRKSKYGNTFNRDYFIEGLLKERIEAYFTRLDMARLKGRNILDIGCGGQPFRNVLTDSGLTYEGMDIVQNQFNNVDHIHSLTADDLPEGMHGRYDYLLLTEVLEHVFDWDAAFRNIKLLLNEGGKAICTTPFLFPLHEEPNDFLRPTIHLFRLYAGACNLVIEEHDHLGGALDVMGTLLSSSHFHTTRKIWQKGGIRSRLMVYALKYIQRGTHSDNLRNNWIASESPFFHSTFVVIAKGPHE